MNVLQNDIVISSPADLVSVLREVKAHLIAGELRQVDAPNEPIISTRLVEISEEGPWPDYLEALLEDARGNRYRLSVETYHGTGGSWTRL